MELTAEQGRVLGALVEKERSTPQAYPLTDNALLAACNQTTSRDPVVSYDVATVRLAVRGLRELGLLRTVHRTGERSDKHRHELEPALGLSSGQVALLAVLLLRGPQTLAELRARCERLHVFTSLEEVDRELLAMAERSEPLVTLLPRRPGRKEARFGQLLAASDEATSSAQAPSPMQALEAVVARTGQVLDAPAPVEQAGQLAPSLGDALTSRVAQLEDEVADLRREVGELRSLLERATGG